MIAVRQSARYAAAFAAILSAVSVAAQQSSAPQPGFEVATVRMDGAEAPVTSISPRGKVIFAGEGVSLRLYIARAYDVPAVQIEGLPRWDDTTTYSITAKPTGDKPLSDEQFKLAMQQLLAERFHLVAHRTVKQVSGYALVVAKGEPKLEPGKIGASDSPAVGRSGLEISNVTMQRFCSVALSYVLKATVVDATGIPGNFHIKLQYNGNNDPDSSLPTIFTALEEQLGLKLVARKVPLETIVVDHVDREPAEN